MQKLFIICFLFGFLASGSGFLGVDLSTPTTMTEFQCLSRAGVSFATVRCYAGGAPDAACPKSVMAAWQASFNSVSLYFVPCTSFSCPTPSAQIATLNTFINKNSIQYDLLWLAVSNPSDWSPSPSSNQEYFQQLVSSAISLNITVGVYTSENNWLTIIGDTFSNASSLPLWYQKYDGIPSFQDFTPFSGWTTPNTKQYEGGVVLCGTSVDYDYRSAQKTNTSGSTATTATPSTITTTTVTPATITTTASNSANSNTGNSNTGNSNTGHNTNSGTHTSGPSHSSSMSSAHVSITIDTDSTSTNHLTTSTTDSTTLNTDSTTASTVASTTVSDSTTSTTASATASTVSNTDSTTVASTTVSDSTVTSTTVSDSTVASTTDSTTVGSTAGSQSTSSTIGSASSSNGSSGSASSSGTDSSSG